MTVSSTVTRNTHTGDGTESIYSYSYRVVSATHLRVVERDTSGAESELAYITDYGVTGVGSEDGGTVFLSANLADGHTLVIDRVVPVLQSSDFRSQGRFRPQSVEDALDYITMIHQQVEALLGVSDPSSARLMLLGITDTSGGGAYDALSNRIEHLDDPVALQDAATKAYVDSGGGGGGAGMWGGEFTAATEPAASVTWINKIIAIKDPGVGTILKACGQLADDSYVWRAIYNFIV
jgi:hypothetical protein